MAEAITCAEAILIAPSNPVTSIGPIFAIPGIRDALRESSAPVVAVSPIIGRAAVSGPAASLMSAQALEVSIAGVAKAYEDFLDILIAHEADSEFAQSSNFGTVEVHCADILMRTVEDRMRVAAAALSFACPEIAKVPVSETV